MIYTADIVTTFGRLQLYPEQILHGHMMLGQMLPGKILDGQMSLRNMSTVKDGSTNLE